MEGERESSALVIECVKMVVIERKRSESVSSVMSDGSASVKRKRMGVNESVDASELVCMRKIGVRLRKFLFVETNRVSKIASEFILNCVDEYEEQMMRMICKNERLQGD
ncbi:unnamed protein product [Lasius platythorax]|uniref:Uncharacterized protein n=1 Tax=Lasius platythorax TaxID=488582 RepID=A0AAV2MZN7_9HYME